jgi:hypothetical protein
MLTPADRARILALYDLDYRRRSGGHRFAFGGEHYTIHQIGLVLAEAWGFAPKTAERYRELAIHFAGERDGSPGRGSKFRERFLAPDGSWVARRPGILYHLPVTAGR